MRTRIEDLIEQIGTHLPGGSGLAFELEMAVRDDERERSFEKGYKQGAEDGYTLGFSAGCDEGYALALNPPPPVLTR
ncbi:hypothetical protein FDI81_gp65 [Streptomyces phage Hydra]|uniref:Uncharacterized protein n=4 Tax=Likavirus TaxID=1982880 RepID=A0A291AWR8_9CAUD|nr:hypothetical protein AVT22_gp62 [Streptomyces phage Caliburn]YP_009616563.1 hypothetical protein FDI81_gp65 [Streptomyces phage Hydra]ATE84941.1 hypothetical protein SEA_BEARDEDLADY_63 [Streptomyces phage BeardedLady]ATE85466.1 hypothetical protein SEA_OZZIE_62 [Streptomyces phage Ozzie]UJQ86480.1 hypothetical protein SEA_SUNSETPOINTE_62 [Streptomyces phage SunsetPointe]URQ04976.1 hypothetical protein SEA_LEGACY_62 [Streptomyces phage Legacy]AKY03372.1 hypothetical protein SEA_CALIBURN_62 